jgi:hypothetical protein
MVHISEYRTLKPVEVILRRGRGKNNNERNEPNWVCSTHMWKCHNKTLYNYYILIKIFETIK